jgi:hypothetical protein
MVLWLLSLGTSHLFTIHKVKGSLFTSHLLHIRVELIEVCPDFTRPGGEILLTVLAMK